VTVLVGFAAGVMYLHQDRRLKRKLPPPRGVRLPSLEWLARVNGRALVVAVLMLVVGVVSGVVLSALRRAGGLDLLPWHDPVVFATLVMLLWLLSAVAITARYPIQRQGRKVAYLTLVSFVFLAVALDAMLLLDTAHGGKNQDNTARAAVGWVVPAAKAAGFTHVIAESDCSGSRFRVPGRPHNVHSHTEA
jgi:CDP-diglyceride synthetase